MINNSNEKGLLFDLFVFVKESTYFTNNNFQKGKQEDHYDRRKRADLFLSAR